jgi:hypothetical protein
LQQADPARAPRPGQVSQPRQTVLGEPVAPLADGVDGDIELAGDPGVGPATRGQQHDPGTQPILVGRLAAIGALLQPRPLTGPQLDPDGT